MLRFKSGDIVFNKIYSKIDNEWYIFKINDEVSKYDDHVNMTLLAAFNGMFIGEIYRDWHLEGRLTKLNIDAELFKLLGFP